MTAHIEKGKAGRTNYAEWDRLATNLVEETVQEEKAEELQAKTELGLDGKYARSQAEAAEREKADALKETKEKLDNFREREMALVHTMAGLLDVENEESKRAPTTVRLTRAELPEGKRVLVLADSTGASIYDKIILTEDLSQLTSHMPMNPKAKSFPDDAENAAAPASEATTVYGLIKVNLENLHSCMVIVESKIISGTIEIHKCSNLTIKVEKTATAATIQVDQSHDVNIEYYSTAVEPRIYHAGVSKMKVRLQTAGVRLEATADYLKDGAVAVGNATPEEFRFVTQIVNGRWLTEKVVQAGAKALTQREVELLEAKKKVAEEKVLGMAESMIQIKDKDGNPLVTKKDSSEDVVEEIVTGGVDKVVKGCEADKAKGNEAFVAGEYGQAILHYSLALDKAAELTDSALFPIDVVYANRSACFLKLGQHEKAEEDAAASLKINPSNVKAQFRQGLALHAMGRYREAAPILAAAQKLQPKNKQIAQALRFCEVRLQQEHRKRMEG